MSSKTKLALNLGTCAVLQTKKLIGAMNANMIDHIELTVGQQALKGRFKQSIIQSHKMGGIDSEAKHLFRLALAQNLKVGVCDDNGICAFWILNKMLTDLKLSNFKVYLCQINDYNHTFAILSDYAVGMEKNAAVTIYVDPWLEAVWSANNGPQWNDVVDDMPIGAEHYKAITDYPAIFFNQAEMVAKEVQVAGDKTNKCTVYSQQSIFNSENKPSGSSEITKRNTNSYVESEVTRVNTARSVIDSEINNLNKKLKEKKKKFNNGSKTAADTNSLSKAIVRLEKQITHYNDLKSVFKKLTINSGSDLTAIKKVTKLICKKGLTRRNPYFSSYSAPVFKGKISGLRPQHSSKNQKSIIGVKKGIANLNSKIEEEG